MAGTCTVVCHYRDHLAGTYQYLVRGRSVGIGTGGNVRSTGLAAGDIVYRCVSGLTGMYQKVCGKSSE